MAVERAALGGQVLRGERNIDRRRPERDPGPMHEIAQEIRAARKRSQACERERREDGQRVVIGMRIRERRQ
jgi:hypothetical protein